MSAGKHGCCADKACTDSTCMELPAGKTCGHCVHEYRCCSMFGHVPTDTYCDWFPRRFREREILEARISQHVVKAEGESPDATDRERCANASPDGGPTGAGQAAAAAPLGEPS